MKYPYTIYIYNSYFYIHSIILTVWKKQTDDTISKLKNITQNDIWKKKN